MATTDLESLTSTELPATGEDVLERLGVDAAGLAADELAPATRAAYASDWRAWTRWCDAHGLATEPAGPAEDLTPYIGNLRRWVADQVAQGRTMATISRRVTGVAHHYLAHGHPDPTRHPDLQAVLAGARRRLGTAPTHRKDALTVDQLRAMVNTVDRNTLAGARDTAVLLLGFATAMRRSELVAIDVEHLTLDANHHGELGMTIWIPNSKTDQQGKGRHRSVPYGRHPDTCPVTATRQAMLACGIQTGPLFRTIDRHGNLGARLTPAAIDLIVKRSAQCVGLDSARLGAHSLRAGLVTAASSAGAPDGDIMRQTGHRSRNTLDRYNRPADRYTNHVLHLIDL